MHDDEDEGARSLFDIVCGIVGERNAREIVQGLWGCGYTIAPRPVRGDPFNVEPSIVPDGMGYQWIETSEVAKFSEGGWQPVPASRHEGVYCPIGTWGPIEVGMMTLVERPKEIINSANQSRVDRAYKNIDDWAKKYSGLFSGHVMTGASEVGITRQIGDPVLARKVSAAVKIPPALWDHAAAIFVERDRLRDEAAETDDPPDEEWLTKTAIENVKLSLSKDTAA